MFRFLVVLADTVTTSTVPQHDLHLIFILLVLLHRRRVDTNVNRLDGERNFLLFGLNRPANGARFLATAGRLAAFVDHQSRRNVNDIGGSVSLQIV